MPRAFGVDFFEFGLGIHNENAFRASAFASLMRKGHKFKHIPNHKPIQTIIITMRSFQILFLALAILACSVEARVCRTAPKTSSAWGVTTNINRNQQESLSVVELAYRSRFLERLQSVSAKYMHNNKENTNNKTTTIAMKKDATRNRQA